MSSCIRTTRRRWDDQVLKEPLALRIARATVSLRRTLEAGFTTIRDLGTEGAGYADVGLKAAIEKDVIPGPRMVVATRAIVATGSYAPRGTPEHETPKGAEEADGVDALARVVRDQAGRGADWIKLYADYGWGPGGEARPSFTLDELSLVVEVAHTSGRPVAVHATTAEGMRRATLAGVDTIEHGDAGTPEVFRLMAEARDHAVPHARGDETPSSNTGDGRRAGRSGARVASSQARELPRGDRGGRHDLQRERRRRLHRTATTRVSWSSWSTTACPPSDALRAATSVNARMLHMEDRIGRVKVGSARRPGRRRGGPDARHRRAAARAARDEGRDLVRRQ